MCRVLNFVPQPRFAGQTVYFGFTSLFRKENQNKKVKTKEEARQGSKTKFQGSHPVFLLPIQDAVITEGVVC
jgi:hypothetical protein